MITIAVIGRAQQNPEDVVPEAALTAAYEVGRRVAQAGAVLISGGTTGVMEAASRGAQTEGGLRSASFPVSSGAVRTRSSTSLYRLAWEPPGTLSIPAAATR